MKVLHAPYPACGLGRIIVKELRHLGVEEATSLNYIPTRFSFQDDIVINLERAPRLIRYLKTVSITMYALRKYDIFHFHSHGLLPRDLDLLLIRWLGKKIAVYFHGSDIRNRAFVLYTADKYRHPKRVHGRAPPLSNNMQLKQIAKWRKYADRIFVSTPDLLAIIPEASYVPQAIELGEWEFTPVNNFHQNPLTILHAPSHRGMKGTEFVLRTVERLSSLGHNINLVLVEGCSHDKMKDLYKNADIVIDQLLTGAYGVVSVEAMAMGRPVVCYISDDVRLRYPDSLPVVSANPLDLENVLLELISDRKLREELSYRGRKYVETYHDVRIVAKTLLDCYLGL